MCKIFSKFLELIPKHINPFHQKKEEGEKEKTYFTRESKLTFPRLITFILSITVSGKSKGVDGKSGEFFKNAHRSSLWPKMVPICRSTLTKSRSKVSFEEFKDIFSDATKLAYQLFPESTDYTWKEMSVFAFDGTYYTLPATPEIREEFDPGSGLENSQKGVGHYPQCLGTTAYDVFRRIPIARTIVSKNGSERDEAQELIPQIPSGNITMFDRGYPSYSLIKYLNENYDGYYLFRCLAKKTFPALERFAKSEETQAVIHIKSAKNHLRALTKEERKIQKNDTIKLRAIKLKSPDGTLSTLLTNLFDEIAFPVNEIIDLYFRRWEIESYYRDEKVVLEIEKFHSRTVNGIKQELFAAATMSVISRTLMAIASQAESPQPAPQVTIKPQVEPKVPDKKKHDDDKKKCKREFQFKNAIMTLAAEAAILTPKDPEQAITIFKEILQEIRRVKYYRPIEPRPSKPRVTKKAKNRWCMGRAKKLKNA